jgi:hypothetical protein
MSKARATTRTARATAKGRYFVFLGLDMPLSGDSPGRHEAVRNSESVSEFREAFR